MHVPHARSTSWNGVEGTSPPHPIACRSSGRSTFSPVKQLSVVSWRSTGRRPSAPICKVPHRPQPQGGWGSDVIQKTKLLVNLKVRFMGFLRILLHRKKNFVHVPGPQDPLLWHLPHPVTRSSYLCAGPSTVTMYVHPKNVTLCKAAQ